MNRTVFLIDGFNLYHSVVETSNDFGLGGKGTKWLDLNSLCSSYLHLSGNNSILHDIYYFSAYAEYLKKK
jgi:hypothetical protein